jgi:uncharacterized membrane protein
MNIPRSRPLRVLVWGSVLLAPAVTHLLLETAGSGWSVYLVDLSGLTHAVLYTSLLTIFALSLRRGQEPMVTRFARRIHGEVPGEVAMHGRHATIAWCMFFAGQLLVSATLISLASRNTWSLFVNVLDWPLLLTMFVFDYLWRRLRFPHRRHVGVVTTLRTFARRDVLLSHDR